MKQTSEAYSLPPALSTDVAAWLAAAEILANWPVQFFAILDVFQQITKHRTGQTDSGVSARLFGTLLSWLNDRQSDVFVVCTCNDISKLPPEFARSERFDGVFFVDLPTPEQRKAIWNIYLQMFELDAGQWRPKDDMWTGAEIRSCCRLAALFDVPLTAAAQNVVPVAVTAAESVERLRSWASGRCLSANVPGIHQHAGGKRRRKVNVDPSSN